MLTDRLFPEQLTERLKEHACFLSIRFPNEARLSAPGGLLDDIRHEPTIPERFHLTLLVADQCSDDQLAMFLANLSPILPFSLEVTGLKILDGPDGQVLVWSIDPGPALARLQSDLFNAVVNEDMDISVYSEPSGWVPHITIAYDLDNRLREIELPQVKPFRLMVNSFTIGRSYDDYFEVNLPRGVGDRMFVKQHVPAERNERNEKNLPDPISFQEPVVEEKTRYGIGTKISVTDLSKLVHGEQIVKGVLRRAVGIDDGPFTIEREFGVAPDFAAAAPPDRGTTGSKQDGSKVGMKKQNTGFNPDGSKKQFGMAHHWPVEIEIDPDLKELLDAVFEWEGGAAAIVDGILLDSGTSEKGRECPAYDEEIQPKVVQWFDNPESENPLSILEISEMNDLEIQEYLDHEAEVEDGNRAVDPKKNQAKADARGRARSYMFAIDGNEIVGAAMATTVAPDDYRLGILADGAQDMANSEQRKDTTPSYTPENYEDEDFETGYVYLDWLAIKTPGRGYGTQMLGEIFRQAAAEDRGLFLEASKSTTEFYKRFKANLTNDDTIFWTAEEVTEWAERAENESVVITEDDDNKEETEDEEVKTNAVETEPEEKSLVQREDIDEVVFGQDDPQMLRPIDKEHDDEPLGGDFTLGNALWIEKPRPWKRQFRAQINEFAYMSEDDARILDTQIPLDQQMPDERESMLRGVQRAMDNLVNRIFKKRHGQPAPPISQPVEPDGVDAKTPEEFTRLAKVLTRIMGERMDVDINPSDAETYAEIKETLNDWQDGADDIADGFLSDVKRQTNIIEIFGGEVRIGDDREIDYDAYNELETEYVDAIAEGDVNTLGDDYDNWVAGYYEENDIDNWADLEVALMDDFDLTEQQIRSMGSQELHNLVGDQAAIATLEDHGYIDEGEYEHLGDVGIPSGGTAGGDYGDSLRSPGAESRPPTQVSEIFNSVAWNFVSEDIRENISLADIESHFGGIPRIDNETGDTVQAEVEIEGGFDVSFSPNQHAFVGRENGEIVAVLSATVIRDHAKVSQRRLEDMIEDGTSRNLGLTDEETMALEGQTFVTLNYLAAKRGGAGHGTEMILRGLKLASDNNAGIIGDSVREAAGFYTKLGARWFTEHGHEQGGPALFTPADVKTLVTWLEASGLDIDNIVSEGAKAPEAILTPEQAGQESAKPSAEPVLAGASLTLRFSPDEVAEALQDDPAAHFTRFTRAVSEKQTIETNDEWVDKLDAARPVGDLLQKRHGDHEGQKGEEGRRGGSQEGYSHSGAESSGGKKSGSGKGGRLTTDSVGERLSGTDWEPTEGSLRKEESEEGLGTKIAFGIQSDLMNSGEIESELQELFPDAEVAVNSVSSGKHEVALWLPSDEEEGGRTAEEADMAKFGPPLPLPGQDFDYDLAASNAWLRENFAEGMKHLNSQEVQSIASYKHNAHGDINRFLRDEQEPDAAGIVASPENLDALDPETAQEYIATIDGVMQRTEVPEPVVAYRGMDLEDLGQLGRNFDDLEGEVFTFKGYTSTSLDKQMAQNFAGTFEPGLDDTKDAEPPVLLRIQVPQGTKAIWTEDTQVGEAGLMGGFEESELLLDRGLQFRVISTGREGDVRTMTVEVVPGSGANQGANVDFADQQAAIEQEEMEFAEMEQRADHPEEENTHEDEDTSQKDDTSENREDSEDREVDEERRDYWIWSEEDINLLDRREVEGQKEAGDRQAKKFSKGLDEEEDEEVVERVVVGPLRRVVIVRHGKHIDQKGEEGRRGGSAAGFTHEEGSVGGIGGKKVVGITSAKGEEGADAQVFHDMREFEDGLRSIKTVRNVVVNPARGIFFSDVESSWSVSYEGNGDAEDLIQKTVDEKNQEMAIIWDESGDADYMIDFSLRRQVTPADRKEIEGILEKAGIPGGTWSRTENGGRIFRTASAIEIEGSMSKEEYRTAASILSDTLNSLGYDHTTEDADVVAKVIRRSEE